MSYAFAPVVSCRVDKRGVTEIVRVGVIRAGVAENLDALVMPVSRSGATACDRACSTRSRQLWLRRGFHDIQHCFCHHCLFVVA